MNKKDIKEKIQMLLCGDLSLEEKKEIEKLIGQSVEINNYYLKSKDLWKDLESLDEIQPSNNYITKFWNKVEEKENSRFDLMLYLRNYWRFAGSFAVIIIAGVFVINSYTGNESADFVLNPDDQEILNQLDNAITLNGDSTLEVYGPW